VVFIVENIFDVAREININEINQDGYSTKGENRGHGLDIANKLLNKPNIQKIL
jgi:hypothetical protein